MVVGSAVTLTRYQTLTYVGVETLNGVNTLLAIDSRINGPRRWTLDADWNFVSATNSFPASDTADLFSYEEGFQYDIDANAEIGGTVFTAIEETGSTTLNRDQDGKLYAGTKPIMVVGSAVTLTRYQTLTYVGVETVNGVNTLLAIDSRINGPRRWILDADWNFVSATNSFPSADTSELYEYETAFEYDLDANTAIGGPTVIAVEQVGLITLNKNTASGQFFAGDVPIMVGGRIVTPTRYPHLTYIGVDTIDGVNILLANDARIDGPRRWTLDADWNFVSATNSFPDSGTAELSSLEQAFQYDLDGDLQIGS
jgi:hypothetical protein